MERLRSRSEYACPGNEIRDVPLPSAAKIQEMIPSIKERRNEQSSMRQIVQQHFRELQ
jgi:hypothetical protein